MVVPAEMLEATRKRYPALWVEAMPPGLQLYGRALMPNDLIGGEN